jgi:2-phospho-L-lactate guanylyltransferase
MKYSALVPVKTLALAKSRLAASLTQHQRESLVLDMLQHVVTTLNDSEIFEQVYVVSADARVLELVQHWGAEPLRETRAGHNPALQAAAETILERTAWRHGVHLAGSRPGEQTTLRHKGSDSRWSQLRDTIGLLTISADLPLLSLADIHALIKASEHYQVVLASSSEGTGTNALLLRPPLILPYLFGLNSLPAYIAAARKHRLRSTLVTSVNLAFDIDTGDDLYKLEHESPAWSSLASMAI